MWSIVIRTVAIYFVVFLIMRFMGKREIGKLSVLDLVISVMVAEIAVIVIEDVQRSMWDGIVPMVVLLVIQVATAVVSMYNRKIRLLFDGKPSVIIDKGKLNRDVMRKQRYNLDDLMLQLRENKITSVADVEFAILETSGKLSVIPKEGTEEAAGDEMPADEHSNLAEQAESADRSGAAAQAGDGGQSDAAAPTGSPGQPAAAEQAENAGLSTPSAKEKLIPPGYRYEILPIPLIMDGKVQDENLSKIDKTRFWLKNVLQEQGANDFKDVFLCTIDHKGKLFVDVKRKKRT